MNKELQYFNTVRNGIEARVLHIDNDEYIVELNDKQARWKIAECIDQPQIDPVGDYLRRRKFDTGVAYRGTFNDFNNIEFRITK